MYMLCTNFTLNMEKLAEPVFFFFTKRIGAPKGDLLGRIKPALVNSSSCFLSSSNSVALRRKVGRDGGDEPGVNSIR